MEEKKVWMVDKKLTEEDLDRISGGYVEHNNNLSSYKCEIVCPGCGENRESYLNYSYDPDIPQFTDYECRTCGRKFRYESDPSTMRIKVYFI